MPYLEVDHRRLFYERGGQPDGPALMLLNGITMNTSAWTWLMPVLEKSFDVIRVDFCGQGLSDKPDEASYPLARQASDAAALLAQLKVGRAHVLGLSYGGMVALHFARHHPERVDRLLLAATLAWSDPVNALIARNWIDSDKAGGFALRFDSGLPWLFSSRFLAAQAHLLPTLRQFAEAVDWPAAQRLSHGVLEHDARSWLGEIRCPTLVVVGSEDRLTPRHQAELLAHGIAGARLLLLDGCAHALHLEAPDALAGAAQRFLLQP